MNRFLIYLGVILIPLSIQAQQPDNRVLSDVSYKVGDALTDYEKERCQLDVYLPASGGDWPVLVWFHGGGLKAGDKRGTPEDGVRTETIARSLAREGIVVVCPNYRLSPEVKYPAYLKDAAAAVAWAKGNLAQRGANVERLYIGGHSAGGWIAFMLGLDPSYLEQVGVKPGGVAGLIPVSGQTMTHFTVREERGLGRFTIVADGAAPVHHIRKNTPRFLVIFGDKDMVGRADENEYFVEMMKGAGNQGVQGLRVAERNHGTIASEIASEEDPARKEILKFIGVPES